MQKRKGDISDKRFISLMIRKIAQTSVSSSALRNQGAKGVIEVARNYFENKIDLIEFRQELYSDNYKGYLDAKTEELVSYFPEDGKSWGAARKGLNLYFRDIIYNYYLRNFLKIDSKIAIHIKKLEVPLDKDVAEALMNKNPDLEKWKSIKSLTPKMSENYQISATEIANKKEIARVHLDLEYWRKKSQ